MSNFEPGISVCRYCRSYHSEGRRGGFCMQLGTPVQGCWKACSYAIPPFAPSWEMSVGIAGNLAQTLWQRSPDAPKDTVTHRKEKLGSEQSVIEVVGTCSSDTWSDQRYGQSANSVPSLAARSEYS